MGPCPSRQDLVIPCEGFDGVGRRHNAAESSQEAGATAYVCRVRGRCSNQDSLTGGVEVELQSQACWHGRQRRMTDWMTLLGSARTLWHRARLVSDPTRTIFAPERTPPRVPAEYLSLYTYLDHRYAADVVLTFEQMEALLGFALPASACTEPDWWTGAAVPTRCHSAAWTVAGRTATPNLPARIVTFARPA